MSTTWNGLLISFLANLKPPKPAPMMMILGSSDFSRLMGIIKKCFAKGSILGNDIEVVSLLSTDDNGSTHQCIFPTNQGDVLPIFNAAYIDGIRKRRIPMKDDSSRKVNEINRLNLR